MVTLVVEDGSGKTNSNAYTSLADADAYWETNFYTATWDALTDAQKNVLIVMATRLLDDWVDWNGTITDENQALRWPRYGVLTRDGYAIEGDEMPTFLVNATAELANYLAKSDPTAEPDTKGFSELGVGDLKLKVDKIDRDNTTVLPDSVLAIIDAYGSIRSRGGSGNVPLIRV